MYVEMAAGRLLVKSNITMGSEGSDRTQCFMIRCGLVANLSAEAPIVIRPLTSNPNRLALANGRVDQSLGSSILSSALQVADAYGNTMVGKPDIPCPSCLWYKIRCLLDSKCFTIRLCLESLTYIIVPVIVCPLPSPPTLVYYL